MSGDASVVSVENLSKQYVIGGKDKNKTFRDMLTATFLSPLQRLKYLLGNVKEDQKIWALKNINFKLNKGEVVGIIGKNGAGKSTLLKVLSRITAPSEGRVQLRGKLASLLEVGTGFHPELSGRENIYLNGAILGMNRREISKQFDAIVDFAEVEKFLDTPVKRYSSGMYVRLAFAVAAHLEPDILVVDEVLAVGDASFQNKCLGKLGTVATEGRTILFVSHNMSAINQLCTRAIRLSDGKIMEDGAVAPVVENYLKNELAATGSWQQEKALQASPDTALLSVQIYDYKNSATAVVPFDKAFTVEVIYRSIRRDKFYVLAVRVSNSMGIDIFTSWDSDSLENRTTSVGNTYRGVCGIPDSLLRPGTYTMTVMMRVMGYGTVERMETANFTFQVSEVGFNINQNRFGIVTPVLKWQLERVL